MNMKNDDSLKRIKAMAEALSKLQKAQKLGVRIMSEDEFLSEYGFEDNTPAPQVEGSLF